MMADRLRVAVIGGGIAGVSIAFELAAEARVTLLEREAQLAQHTTGRSAAHYLKSLGNVTVRALTAASEPGFARIQRDLDTAPLLTPEPNLWVADEEARPRLDALLTAAGHLRELTRGETLDLCPALRPELLAGAALDTEAQRIDVMALHQGYARGIVARGGEIRAAAPALELARIAGGWRVGTPRGGRLDVDVVVDAAGAWADEVARLADIAPVAIRPLRRTIFTSPIRWPEPVDAWPFVDDCGDRFYFRAEHDQVMVSPVDEAPDVPRDARPEEVDIARAIEVVNRHTLLDLRSVRSAWAGLRCFVADRSPVVGCREGEPGFFWFAGQGGYGIQTAPALALAAAELLLRGRLPDALIPDLRAADISPDRLAPATGR